MKNQKIIAEGKVNYWGIGKPEVWIGNRRDDGFVLQEKLASKLYRYRGKNIKLIVETIEKNK